MIIFIENQYANDGRQFIIKFIGSSYTLWEGYGDDDFEMIANGPYSFVKRTMDKKIAEINASLF